MAEARERAGLTVRQLSERTRVRETVIERFERDDFSVGDFYARGHIRTIASDLGLDPDEILRQYEQENADIASPVKASAVFRGDVGERARRAPTGRWPSRWPWPSSRSSSSRGCSGAPAGRRARRPPSSR
ncbi:hypothetical protein GCM10027612_32540 [Microbispora bryophytorum subsp. camponoti]